MLARRSLFRGTSVATAARCLSSGAELVTVHGHYVSQPARSVLWLLKINEQPFNFAKVDVMKGETRMEAYKSKFPTCLIPGLEDGEFCLAEGSAIMQYLCEKYDWDQWWPIGNDTEMRQKRAKIAEFLSSHQHTTRLLSHEVVRPLFFSKTPLSEEQRAANLKVADQILQRFENAFLSTGAYVNGMSHPTIADLTAYAEIGQLVHFNILPNFDAYPVLQTWAEKIEALPHYDDVHQSNIKMGEMFRKKYAKK
jgi:glutathione S-transferase